MSEGPLKDLPVVEAPKTAYFNTADVVVSVLFVLGLAGFYLYKKYQESNRFTIQPISLQYVLCITIQHISLQYVLCISVQPISLQYVLCVFSAIWSDCCVFWFVCIIRLKTRLLYTLAHINTQST